MSLKQSRNCWAFVVVLLFALPMLMSCNREPKESVEYISNDAEDLSEFNEFYKRFHSDSAYQLEHIQFPLEGLPGFADSLLVTSGKFYYKKAGWKIMKPIRWDTSGFQRVVEPTGFGVINEYVCTKNHFCMTRRFAKLHDGWFLIYYTNFNYRPDMDL